VSDAALRQELRSAIADWDQSGGGGVGDDTPLISSGRLDSFNLLRLVLWIEGEIGQPVDATSIDLAAEWDTVDQIVEFVARHRAANSR
jgi:acyl carrier protein